MNLPFANRSRSRPNLVTRLLARNLSAEFRILSASEVWTRALISTQRAGLTGSVQDPISGDVVGAIWLAGARLGASIWAVRFVAGSRSRGLVWNGWRHRVRRGTVTWQRLCGYAQSWAGPFGPTSVDSWTGFRPFYPLYGRSPRQPRWVPPRRACLPLKIANDDKNKDGREGRGGVQIKLQNPFEQRRKFVGKFWDLDFCSRRGEG